MSPLSATCSRQARMRSISARDKALGGWRPMSERQRRRVRSPSKGARLGAVFASLVSMSVSTGADERLEGECALPPCREWRFRARRRRGRRADAIVLTSSVGRGRLEKRRRVRRRDAGLNRRWDRGGSKRASPPKSVEFVSGAWIRPQPEPAAPGDRQRGRLYHCANARGCNRVCAIQSEPHMSYGATSLSP